ncbi:MAG TPA: hypothetical protein VFJ13_10580 [Paracoccaceae bacterium]|nr:hypothetical protein [Paracoccaceae bacterium]
MPGGMTISPVIADPLPVERFDEGFEAMRLGDSGKVVPDWM